MNEMSLLKKEGNLISFPHKIYMIIAGPVKTTDQLDQGNEDSIPTNSRTGVLEQMKETKVKSCLQFPFALSSWR